MQKRIIRCFTSKSSIFEAPFVNVSIVFNPINLRTKKNQNKHDKIYLTIYKDSSLKKYVFYSSQLRKATFLGHLKDTCLSEYSFGKIFQRIQLAHTGACIKNYSHMFYSKCIEHSFEKSGKLLTYDI